jgi:hypothetical protein
MRSRFISLISLLFMAATIHAGDFVFSAGSLPQLADDSSVVIRAKSVDVLARTDRSIIYRVTWVEKLKGSLPTSIVDVLCPLADGELAQESFDETLFFLGDSLSDSQKKYFGLPADSGPVYPLVSARRGIVPVNSAQRRMAVVMYFGTHDDVDPEASKLAWAEQHRDDSSDLLLQESAVYEMERQSDTKRALQSLSSTIRDGDIAPATRELALRVVGDAEGPGAVDILEQTATNGHHPDTLRKSAVQKLLKRSDSKEAIDRILKGRDKALAEIVRSMSEAVKSGDV